MTRPSLFATGPSAVRSISTRAHRCQLSLLSVAVAVAIGAFGSEAHALALGRLNVQSSLGEPLRAEIDVTEMSAAEADGFKVGMASREAFQAAGVTYNDALSNVRATLQRRADGRYVIRLNGSRPMNEPFVDLLLEANWASGRIVRDYTLLLDPAGSRQANAAPVAPIAPQLSPAPAPAPRAAVAQSSRAAASAPARQRTAPAAPAEGRVRTEGGEQQVTVRAGDTAGRIAAGLKPADVSLDQMLVALLRANPDAFINGNVNRIRAGAVVQVPNAAAAASVPADEARRTVVAQSRDFGSYRRRLAENAPTSRVADADRRASGRLQANVDDRNAASTSPDKLTVSQGAAARSAEDKLAQARQTQESNTRAAEISRNINDLNKIQTAGAAGTPAAATGSTAAAPTTPAAAPAPAAPAPVATPVAAVATPAPASAPSDTANAAAAATPAAPVPAATPAVSTPASEGTAAAPVAAAPAATPAPAPKPKVAPPPPAPEPGFFAQLMENPLMLALGAVLLALIGFLLYRVFGRKKHDAVDSVFPESRLPKDSFFNTTGGESVDTKGRSTSLVSSLSYSPSQLDAGDVDPVAEADVYLAYGRDLQAEEILREALRTTPERTAIHLKLLEIHAKRRDLRAFEALAADVRNLTGGSGTEWTRVIDMGRELDPGNPLYQGNVAPVDTDKTVPLAAAASTAAAIVAAPSVTAAPPPPFVPSVAPLDFDLDLGKSSAAAPLSDPSPAPLAAPAPATRAPTTATPAFEATLRSPLNAEATHTQRGAPAAVPPTTSYEPTTRTPLAQEMLLEADNDLDTAPAELSAQSGAADTHQSTLRSGLPGDSGFIEFDMSTLSSLQSRAGDTSRGELDGALRASRADDNAGESPQAIKLSLARELQALGDAEGARSLVEEVVSESSGGLRQEAEQLLAQLR